MNKPVPMGYKTSKVGNLFPTFLNLLFIDTKGMKHMNAYCTKFFSQIVSFNLLVILHQMNTQKVRKIKGDNFTQTLAKKQQHVSK